MVQQEVKCQVTPDRADSSSSNKILVQPTVIISLHKSTNHLLFTLVIKIKPFQVSFPFSCLQVEIHFTSSSSSLLTPLTSTVCFTRQTTRFDVLAQNVSRALRNRLYNCVSPKLRFRARLKYVFLRLENGRSVETITRRISMILTFHVHPLEGRHYG